MCIIVILTGGEASSGIKIENIDKDEGEKGPLCLATFGHEVAAEALCQAATRLGSSLWKSHRLRIRSRFSGGMGGEANEFIW